MAFTTGNDVNILQATDTTFVGAGLGNDKYILSGTGLGATQTVNITDVDGTNTLQLIGGLTIASSKVNSTTIQLILSNGATVNILGANTFSYEIGGNPLTNTPGTIQTFSSFVTTSLGLAAAPTTSAVVDGAANVGVNADGTTTVSPPVVTTPTFSITAGAASADEGTTATFTVDLAGRTAGVVYTVNVAQTSVGTAATPADYSALALDAASVTAGFTYLAGVLTVPASIAGTTAKAVFTSLVATDVLAETGEGTTVTLSAPTAASGTAAVLDAAKSAGTTTFNDVVNYAVTAAATSVNEGAVATFNVVTELSEAGKTVAYTLSGTGITTADVTGGLTGKATIGADGKATISISVVADATTENTPETLTLTLDGKSKSASTIINDTSVGPDASYYLLKTQDIQTANKFFASQTYFNVDGVGPTLNTGDFLTGTAGRTDNELTVTDLTPGVTNGVIPAGVTLTNIQKVSLNSSNNTTAGTGFSTVGFADVRALNGTTNGAGADTFTAKNGTDGTVVTVSHKGFGGSLTVVGGTDVTATSVGGAVIVGNTATAVVPLAEQVATGKVVVNQQFTGAGAVNVFGGTTVDVATTSTSNSGVIQVGNTTANTGNTTAGAVANPTGAVKVDTSGTGAVTVFGGSDVTITNKALAGAGALTVGDSTYVTPTNLPTGNVSITETAAIAYNNLAGSSNNATTSGSINVYGGKNVTISSNAANYVNIGNLGAAKENALNPTGTISVTNTGIVNNVADAGVGGSKGAMLITGGTDVTVSTTGANVTIGRSANAALIDQASNPSGNVSVTETMNGNGFARAIVIDGGKDVTVNGKGQNVTIGKSASSAPSGAVSVTQSDMLTGNGAYLASTNAGDVTVFGATTVTVNTTGGNVAVGGVNDGGVNSVPSGAVVIARTFSGPGADTTSVQGGTTVNITSTKTSGTITVGDTATDLDAAGVALKNAVLAPTGDVTIVDATTVGAVTKYGTGNVNVNSNGAATVSVKGGDTDAIKDIQATLATGGANAGKAVGTSKLATVVIDGLQAADGVTIASDALTALTLTNVATTGNNVAVTNNTAGHALTITQGGNASYATVSLGAFTTTVTDAAATSVTVTDNGTDSFGTLALTTVKATTLTVNNAARAVIDVAGDTELTTLTLKGAGATTIANVSGLTKVTSIDASASSGSVTTSIAPTTTAGVAQKFTGGTGAATLTVNSNAITWGDGVLLTGGSGSNDVLVANYVAGTTKVGDTDIALGSGTASVKGFEYLGLGATASSATAAYDASGFSGVTMGAVAADVKITNAAKNATLAYTAAPGFNTNFIGSTSATSGASDALTITVNTNTPNYKGVLPDGISAGTVTTGTGSTAGGYDAISIVSQGGKASSVSTGGDAATPNTLTLANIGSAGSATLAVSGSAMLTLTDANTGFSKIDVTNTSNVVLTNVVASPAGVAITGGSGKLTAVGAAGGTQVVKTTLDGTGAKTFAIGDTWVVTVNGETFTYTAAATDSMATAAAYMSAALTAFATTGPVAKAGAVAAPAAFVAVSSGANLIMTTTGSAIQMYSSLGGGNTGTVTSAGNSLVGGREEALITVSGTGTAFAAGDNLRVVIDGVDITSAVAAAAETSAQMAARLATAITTAIGAGTAPGLTSAVASGSNVILTGGSTGVALIGAVSQPVNTGTGSIAINTPAINYATANDSFTSGSGGGVYSAGLGGSWSNTLHGYSSGSESVSLAASTAKTDVLKLADGRVVTNNGTLGGVTSFTTGSLTVSDNLFFATAGKTAVANVSVAATVNALTGAATMAAVLDPSGNLLTAMGNLTYTIANGVITFSATGGHSLTEFTTAQLISAAELIVNSTTTGGANRVAAFSSGGNTYVVATDAATTLATGVDAKDVLVQLTGVASTTGFGITGAQGAIVTDAAAFGTTNGVTYTDSGKVNSGSASVAVYDQTGYSRDTISAAEFGTSTTSITNLAPSSKLTLNNGGAAYTGTVSTSQTGTAGLNSLTLNTAAADTFAAVNVSGAGLLALAPTGATTITALADSGSTNTLAILSVAGTSAITVSSFTDTALAAVSSTSHGAAFTLGATATPVTNNGVSFALAVGQASTLFTSGANNVFVQGAADNTGTGVVTLTASGATNTITLSNGANVITANGAGDVISVGIGSNTITATGSGDTISVASGAGTTSVTVGTGATVNIGTAYTANAGAETVNVIRAVTGGTTASYVKTTINFAGGSTIVGNKIDFSGDANAFTLLGASAAASQVNVSTAGSLNDALNMAANYTLLTQVQGTAATTADLAANTGKIDWFQYGGDTYVVAMVNDTASAVQQTALNANDIVVKITGMVDLTGSALAAEVLTL